MSAGSDRFLRQLLYMHAYAHWWTSHYNQLVWRDKEFNARSDSGIAHCRTEYQKALEDGYAADAEIAALEPEPKEELTMLAEKLKNGAFFTLQELDQAAAATEAELNRANAESARLTIEVPKLDARRSELARLLDALKLVRSRLVPEKKAAPKKK